MLRRNAVWFLLIGLLAACMPNNAPLGPEVVGTNEAAGAHLVQVEVAREQVFAMQGDSRQSISASEQVTELNPVEQGVGVDRDGRALLHFDNQLTLELLRGAEIPQIQQGDADVKIAQNGGTIIADLTAAKNPRSRLTVQTAFGTIVASNARFAVVREEDSPLEWVLGLEAGDNSQLEVVAGGGARPVLGGQARWITSSGPPSPAIVLSPEAQSWLEGARNNVAQPEIGEVLLTPANIVADTGLLSGPPPTGRHIEFGRDVHGAVQMTLDPVGIFGNPGYTLEDCNDDGKNDLSIKNGSITFNFEELLARVQAIDLTLINRDQSDRGLLQVFDPAGAAIDQQQIKANTDQPQTLSLRSDRPYYAAELRLSDGCLLGLSLTPPGANGQPPPTRPAQPPVQRDTVVNVLAASAERRPENGQFEAPGVTAGQITIDGSVDDWNSLTPSGSVDWASFATIIYDNGCANRFPDAAGTTDLSGRVRFAYDDQNFYVAFQVDDDGLVPYTGPDNRLFLGDSAQLLLDLDLTGDFDSTSLSGDDVQVDMLANPAAPRVALWQLGTLTSSQMSGASIAVTPSATGYILEAALPWSQLGRTPPPGDRLGLAAAVNDNDTPNTNAQECIISTAPQRDWRNPATWGTVLLQPAPVE